MSETTYQNSSSRRSTYEVLSDSVRDALYDTLLRINPLLTIDTVRTQVEVIVDNLIALLASESFDARPAYDLGLALEAIDSCQPGDLQTLQEVLAAELTTGWPAMRPSDFDRRVQSALFALGTGFFAGKAQRAKQLDMSAMSRMSHDMKTPINAITGFSRVILKGIDGPITEFQREDITSIYEAGQKLLTMIDDVFSVRKRDAARTLIHDAEFNVAELFADVVHTIQPLAAEHEHTLELRLVRDLGRMKASASMVRWVMLGLLHYLMRQSSGSIISVTAYRDPQDDMALVVEMSHRLSESLLSFQQREGRPTEDEGLWASDIALITSHRFCEDMGGEVVRTEEAEGVTFQIRLPATAMSREAGDIC